MAQVILNIRREKVYKVRKEPETRDYKSLYRFQEQNVIWMSNHFLGENEERRGGALTSKTRMQIFLRYMADPGFQSGIGEEMNIHQSTVSKTIKYVSEKIIQKASLWIQFPSSPQKIRNAKQLWQDRFRFPTAIGALDCTHVRIQKPGPPHGDEYINRKGFPSINVQATCNAREIFTSVDASWPGSVHDSRIWKNSLARQAISNSVNCVLLADSGYGIEPWLMTPYRNPINNRQSAYNQLLKTERVVIERCFGQLKRRFPILQYVNRVKLNRIANTIVCCFVLHNIAKYLQDEDFPDDDREENFDQGEDLAEGEIRIRGKRIQEQLATLIEQF